VSQGSSYQFNADDIRRYFHGEMSSSESHALETAALDDPFLADAMEGYASLPGDVVSADLSTLQSRLDQRVSSQSTVSHRPSQWLSIAAATIVVLGSAVVLWLTTGSPEPKIIAKIEERPAVDNTAPILADSNSQPPIVESEVAQESKPKPRAAKIPAQESPKTAVTSPVISDTIQGAMAMKEEAKPENKQSGILDKLDRSKLDDDVSAKKIRSQAAPSAATQMNAKSKKEETPQGGIYAEPSDGWSSFEIYMHNNLRRPKDPVLQGNVIVSFSVNPENGKLYDLKVDKSLSPLYDKEAIRVLREGPAWAVYNTEGPVKTTYTVVF
jgi:hypothetical protein